MSQLFLRNVATFKVPLAVGSAGSQIFKAKHSSPSFSGYCFAKANKDEQRPKQWRNWNYFMAQALG